MRLEHWTDKCKGIYSWYWRLSFWRVELELAVRRHTYPIGNSSDRWDIQPHLIYDRKHK